MGHIHGDSEYDYTASAMIVYEDMVLLLFHRKLQMWLPPAGHVELDETPVEALYREVEEETGLTKNQLTMVETFHDNHELEYDPNQNILLPIPFDINIHTVTESGHRHIDMAYIVKSDTDMVRNEERGAEKLAWFTLDEIRGLSPMPKLTYSHAKYALKKVKELQK